MCNLVMSLMDDFIAELERSISNVGATKFWKKKFGDTVFWLSPLTLKGQEAITEMLGNADKIGVNVINETKRVTISNAVVGINDIDLRDFRDGTPSFPSVGRDGKPAKVTLDKYIYNKIAGWSAQLLDDVFSVYSDIMETHQKENLSSIKFENAKDPEVELKELEDKVSELRVSLGKPPLVEKTEETAKEDLQPVQQSQPEAVKEAKPVVEVPFDPFAAVISKRQVPDLPPQIAQAIQSAVQPAPQPVVQSVPQPVVQPSPEKDLTTSNGERIKAYVANPSVSSEVVEGRAEQVRVAPPVIDPVVHNRNPRFQQQR